MSEHTNFSCIEKKIECMKIIIEEIDLLAITAEVKYKVIKILFTTILKDDYEEE